MKTRREEKSKYKRPVREREMRCMEGNTRGEGVQSRMLPLHSDSSFETMASIDPKRSMWNSLKWMCGLFAFLLVLCFFCFGACSAWKVLKGFLDETLALPVSSDKPFEAGLSSLRGEPVPQLFFSNLIEFFLSFPSKLLSDLLMDA
mmetsp:Transcript_20823/g.41533  ORF Transcript_20823/g.41533 Transcript_20823/m.41533 type:complete len:146 (+) Transcript_20823:2855-3292(+)